jgi:hypothetical protein
MTDNRYRIDQSPFFRLRTKRRLAMLLGLSMKELLAQSDAALDLYSEWDILKPNGKARHIENPKPPLKQTQKRIAKLLSRIAALDLLMCPVRGRSFIDNAKRHLNQREVRTIDLKEYFPNTTSRRVYWFFRKRMECSPDVAEILTALSTLNGHLPTGSPLSPILSYFAHIDMWEEVNRIANVNSAIATAYVDDITLSGGKGLGDVLWEVKKAVHSTGLRYHKEKRFQDSTSEITGVVVDHGVLKAPHRAHLRGHQARKKLARTGLNADLTLQARVRGHDGLLAQIKKTNT